MSETPIPWYERNSVLWAAGTVVAVTLLLVQPFIDRSWPATVGGLLSFPRVKFALTLTGYAAVFAGGYALGRRRRPYSGPLFNVETPASVTPVKVAPKLNIVEISSGVRLEVRDLAASTTWAITPEGRSYAPVRADLFIRERTLRGGVSIEVRGEKPWPTEIPADRHGRVHIHFRAPDDIGPAGEHFAGEVTLTDAFGEPTSRTIDFGPIPSRSKPA